MTILRHVLTYILVFVSTVLGSSVFQDLSQGRRLDYITEEIEFNLDRFNESVSNLTTVTYRLITSESLGSVVEPNIPVLSNITDIAYDCLEQQHAQYAIKVAGAPGLVSDPVTTPLSEGSASTTCSYTYAPITGNTDLIRFQTNKLAFIQSNTLLEILQHSTFSQQPYDVLNQMSFFRQLLRMHK